MSKVKRPQEKQFESSKSLKVKKTAAGQSPGINRVLEKPNIPLGEDENSFSRHNQKLKKEYKKRHPNMTLVDELMDVSFSMRRRDLLDNPCDITTVFANYPCLQNPEQVLMW